MQRSKRWIERLPVAPDRLILRIINTSMVAGTAWLLGSIRELFLPTGFPALFYFPGGAVTFCFKG